MKIRFTSSLAVFMLFLVPIITGCGKPESGHRSVTQNRKPSQPTFAISGTVVNAKGKLVTNLPVYLVMEDMVYSNEDRDVRKAVVIAKSTSDKEGQYRFSSIPRIGRESSKTYRIIASGLGDIIGWSRKIMKWDIQELDKKSLLLDRPVKLFPLCNYSGKVVDDKGYPLSGANVILSKMGYDNEFSIDAIELNAVIKLPSATTSSSGGYILRKMPICGRKILVLARKPGYAQYPNPYESHPQKIVMVPAGGIAGRLTDEHGKPIAGRLIQANDKYDKYENSVTAEDGSFLFKALPAGTYDIGILTGCRTLLVRNIRGVKVEVGKTVRVPDLIKSDGIDMEVSAVDFDTGKPVRGAFTHVKPGSYKTFETLAFTTNSQGRFHAKVIPGETYLISYEGLLHYYSVAYAKTEVTIPRGVKNFDCELRIPKIQTGKGKVLAPDEKPMVGAIVLVPELLSCNAAGPQYGLTRTDKNGNFEVGLLDRKSKSIPAKVTVRAYNKERTLYVEQVVSWKDITKGSVALKLSTIGGKKLPHLPPDNMAR